MGLIDLLIFVVKIMCLGWKWVDLVFIWLLVWLMMVL